MPGTHSTSTFGATYAPPIFGPLTHGRVLEFLGQSRLERDGIVGPVTTEVVHDLLSQLGFDTGRNDPNFVLPVRVNVNVAVPL